jgi:hypothetical protein
VIELRPSNEKSSWWKEAEEKMIALVFSPPKYDWQMK